MENTQISSPREAEPAAGIQADARETAAGSTQAENAEATGKREEFERLIRGEYRQEFDERVKRIIDRRFRENRTLKEQAARTQPVVDFLKEAYGEADESALLERLTAEKAAKTAKNREGESEISENYAAEKSENALSEKPEAAKAADAVKALLREKGAKEIERRWRSEEASAKRVHPGIDLDREIQNPRFRSLLRAGVDVITAYETTHARELTLLAMRFAAERTREKTVNDIRARGLRPAENGMDGRGASRMTPPKVANMTRAQREDIERRAARGEKVRFN